jgi:hypothetical protein
MSGKRLSEEPEAVQDIWLAKHGVTAADLVADAHADPDAKPIIKKLRTSEAQRRFALEWFVDQRHKQPTERGRTGPLFAIGDQTHPGHPTPAWPGGRLPPYGDEETPLPGPTTTGKRRHRPPGPIAVATVKDLKWQLTQRATRPKDREFTQEAIAARLGLDRSRVQQAEALELAGWDLLRTHPEFSAEEGFVRWPSPAEAARILASEGAGN